MAVTDERASIRSGTLRKISVMHLCITDLENARSMMSVTPHQKRPELTFCEGRVHVSNTVAVTVETCWIFLLFLLKAHSPPKKTNKKTQHLPRRKMLQHAKLCLTSVYKECPYKQHFRLLVWKCSFTASCNVHMGEREKRELVAGSQLGPQMCSCLGLVLWCNCVVRSRLPDTHTLRSGQQMTARCFQCR